MDEVERNPEEKKESALVALYDWIESFVIALAIVVLLFTFAFKVVTVDGSSMFPTFENEERAIASHLFYTPKTGDIAVVSQPSYGYEPLFKRIVATEGQEVDIDYDTSTVYVDGVALDEPYIAEPMLPEGDQPLPLTVPDGYVFVMGDNRNWSTDSRSSLVGLIDERNVLGKVYLRLFPFSKFGVVS